MEDSRNEPDVVLHDLKGLGEVLERPGPVLLFKHSTACPISARAHGEFRDWLRAGGSRPYVALVHVIEDRPVSNAIAERLGVRHESPQALLVRDGRVAWHASHSAITKDALACAAAG